MSPCHPLSCLLCRLTVPRPVSLMTLTFLKHASLVFCRLSRLDLSDVYS